MLYMLLRGIYYTHKDCHILRWLLCALCISTYIKVDFLDQIQCIKLTHCKLWVHCCILYFQAFILQPQYQRHSSSGIQQADSAYAIVTACNRHKIPENVFFSEYLTVCCRSPYPWKPYHLAHIRIIFEQTRVILKRARRARHICCHFSIFR